MSLLGLLFAWIDLRAMASAVAQIRLDFLLLLIAIIGTIRLVGAFRWYVLLRDQNRNVSYLGVVRLTFVSDFMGYFAPGTLGVDAIRLYGMSRTTSNPALSATSMLVERILALLALIVLVLAGLTFELPAMPLDIGSLMWLAVVCLVVVLVGLMAPPARLFTLWLLSSPRLPRAHAAVQKVYLSLDQYSARPALLICVFLISLSFQLLRCVSVAIGAMAFGIHLPIVVFVVFMPVIFLMALLPISIAGLGVREFGFVYLLGQAGMPAEVALSLSLLLRLLYILVATPGAWLYFRRGVVA